MRLNTCKSSLKNITHESVCVVSEATIGPNFSESAQEVVAGKRESERDTHSRRKTTKVFPNLSSGTLGDN